MLTLNAREDLQRYIISFYLGEMVRLSYFFFFGGHNKSADMKLRGIK